MNGYELHARVTRVRVYARAHSDAIVVFIRDSLDGSTFLEHRCDEDDHFFSV